MIELLQTIAGSSPHLAELLEALTDKVVCAEDILRNAFEYELGDNADYYQMYERSYFLERVEIEKLDFHVDVYENDILNGLDRLLHNETEYAVKGLIETIIELEEDLWKHADTFFGCAYRTYKSYYGEIEKIAEVHTAVASGHGCGAQRPLCGLTATPI